MIQKIPNPPGLFGERGLMLAVINQATADYNSRNLFTRADALWYFWGSGYQEHLSWLGLPPEWLPDAVINAEPVTLQGVDV